jgi:Fe2+ or Zn2+ uptake regulation protein
MAASPTTRLVDFLTAKGRKFTGQMALVVDVALSRCGTFTHDDVVAETRGVVSRATVYRTLAHMVAADVLRQVQFNGCAVLVAAVAEV